MRFKRKNIIQKSEAKQKNAALGFGVVLIIFGVSLALPFLTAAAKDISAPTPGGTRLSAPTSNCIITTFRENEVENE
jgi:hypothetical protein